ncbi:MAG: lipid-A-disaccharide synthase [Prevotella sp.]|nr:lipid-A-disaccharide synthase [Prevotella sp.]
MKYYLIAGEASGDLHASRLMQSLKQRDAAAEFRFIGGDLMAAVGGTMVRHYRELAYMGFVPVLLHLPTILGNMRRCKQDIADWRPDVVILVDYPGFNLSIARYVKSHTDIPVFYYIAPKIWAWKEYRIKNIKRDVDELFSILPFEVEFFEGKHGYPIHYVGNPTADEVGEYLLLRSEECGVRSEERGVRSENTDIKKSVSGQSPSSLHTPPSTKKTIALLAGSRRQEIKDNLPAMIEATRGLAGDYRIVLAGAPSIPAGYYDRFIAGTDVEVVYNQTYPLLASATAALVTSGTATLETALFGVPQVVCYETPIPKVIAFLRRHLLKVRYISLVNLIADREVVKELVADTFSVENIRRELLAILPGQPAREEMMRGYDDVRRRLGDEKAPDNAARIMIEKMKNGL